MVAVPIHTHHSADASRDSSSAGPTPRRSATGAPAAIKRFSSVVNTRKRSKEARVEPPDVWPLDGDARWNRWRCVCVHCRAQHDLALLDHDEPYRLSPGSRHTTLESNSRVNQIARRRASAARNASHSSDTCTTSGVHTVNPRLRWGRLHQHRGLADLLSIGVFRAAAICRARRGLGARAQVHRAEPRVTCFESDRVGTPATGAERATLSGGERTKFIEHSGRRKRSERTL